MRLPLLLLALLGLVGCTEEERGPPDVVLVVIDTLRADHTGPYGAAHPTTPALSRMAEEGLVFDRAYAHSGWTLPSFASLLTGLLPHDHKVGRDPVRPTRYGKLGLDFETLAELAKKKGYRTAAFVNNSYLAREFGFQQGFDVYDWKGATNDTHRSAAETVEAGLGWLLSGDDEPALLLIHMMEPHLDYGLDDDLRGTFAPKDAHDEVTPCCADELWIPWMSGLNPPEPAVREHIQGLYDEDILAADKALDDLLRRLAARDNTVIAVTSDHGEEFWDHGAFEHGHTLFSELTRVPLVVTGPDIEPGRVTTPVGHTDLFQTLVRQVGLTSVPGTVGDDLLLLADREPMDRYIASENVAYGPPQMSLVHRDHRMVLRPTLRVAEVWKVAADGSDRERLAEAQQQAVGKKMLSVLSTMRGSLENVEIRGVRIDSREVFEQLKSLGYVEDDGPSIPPGLHPAMLDPQKATERAPARFEVRLQTTKGEVELTVHRAWSPAAADRFYNLTKIGFYDKIFFFRVLDDFVVQTGISGIPAVSAVWAKAALPDEPRKKSNVRGTVAFASQGPGTRSTQFFVNMGDNAAELDKQGFVPFAEVTAGMDVLEKLDSRYGEGQPMGRGPDQRILFEEGNRYLQHIYPGLDLLIDAEVVER